MIYNYKPRRKAWLGAAIGAAVGIGSSLFGAYSQKEAQKKQMLIQKNMERLNTGVQGAKNLTEAYANNDELQREFRNRFLRCGGRRRFEGGGTDNASSASNGFKWTSEDTNSLISGLGGAGSSIASTLVGTAMMKGFNPTAIDTVKREIDNEAMYDSASRNNIFNQPQIVYRFGGRRHSRT